MSYEANRGWSDRYIPAICEIIGPRLMIVAPVKRDRDEATDLIFLTAKDVTVAARVRRPGYAERYPDDFTIRDSLPSGAATELTKILQGWGHWMFYGHAAEQSAPSVAAWLLIDLCQLRYFFHRHPEFLHCPDGIGRGRGYNPDGTTFRWYNARIIQRHVPGVLIASHWPSDCGVAA